MKGQIRQSAPKLEPCIRMGMLAYGPYRYKYASGRKGDGFRVGVASNQSYISLYATIAGDMPEHYKQALPKASIGKCCVRFKRLGDLDQTALEKLIKEAASAARKEDPQAHR